MLVLYSFAQKINDYLLVVEEGEEECLAGRSHTGW